MGLQLFKVAPRPVLIFLPFWRERGASRSASAAARSDQSKDLQLRGEFCHSERSERGPPGQLAGWGRKNPRIRRCMFFGGSVGLQTHE